MNHTSAGLSSRELALLSGWELEGRTHVRPGDLVDQVGDRQAALKALAKMTAKGALDRVAHGVYLVRPLRAVGRPWFWSSAAAVAHAMSGQTHYIGGAFALTLHRLTAQIHHAVIDVFVPVERDDRSIDDLRLRFHIAAWEGAFAFGLTSVEVDGVPVIVSDAERTLLDVLDRPELVGDPPAAVETFRAGIGRVDASGIAGYAARWGRVSVRQRAGYLLERAGTSPTLLAGLRAATRPSNPVALFKGGPARGRAHPVWRVVEEST